MRFKKIVEFIYILAAKYLKNGGLGSAKTVTSSQLLRTDYKDSSQFLPVKDLWIGEKAEQMLLELGLTKESSEVSGWLAGVQKFFVELLSKAIKYFKPSLESKTLRSCEVLDPVNCLVYDLDKLHRSFLYLAKKWPNIISREKVNFVKAFSCLSQTKLSSWRI